MSTNPRQEQTPMWHRPGTKMTEGEFHELERLSPDRKYEYINGVAYMMSDGSVAHDRIAYNARLALDLHFRSGPCTVFGPGVQVLLALKKNGKPHFVYPDVTVSCAEADSRADNTLIESPRVIVEVLSPGTETKDRGAKFKAYQSQETIQEIVLTSQFAQYVEVWQRNERDPTNPKAWLYRHYGPGDIVELVSIGARIEVAALYRGLVFDEGEIE
ncbi:MAG TPA: Uma2 family endonuclease [Ktedonosporobacter sp.]|jgi:Uma2 family endonuclease|nr:Uma2 family endonuclease [Ktedonosporobacter sp.]